MPSPRGSLGTAPSERAAKVGVVLASGSDRSKAGIAAFELTAGKLTFAIDALLTGSDTSERIGNHPSRSVQTLDVRKATVM
jgi:hypothetical protein